MENEKVEALKTSFTATTLKHFRNHLLAVYLAGLLLHKAKLSEKYTAHAQFVICIKRSTFQFSKGFLTDLGT